MGYYIYFWGKDFLTERKDRATDLDIWSKEQ